MWTIVRYIFVQLLAYVLDFGTYALLLRFANAEPIFANIAGKIVAAVFAFVTHRAFTFSDRVTPLSKQALQYVLVLIFNAVLSSILLGALIASTRSNEMVLKVISDCICVVATFALLKFFVFSGGTRPSGWMAVRRARTSTSESR